MGARKVADGPTRSLEERLALWESHRQLAKWMVKRFGTWRAREAGCDAVDLQQAADVGLWVATRRWDAARGTAFATCAAQAIRGELLEAIDRARYGRVRHGRPLVDQSAFEPLP